MYFGWETWDTPHSVGLFPKIPKSTSLISQALLSRTWLLPFVGGLSFISRCQRFLKTEKQFHGPESRHRSCEQPEMCIPIPFFAPFHKSFSGSGWIFLMPQHCIHPYYFSHSGLGNVIAEVHSNVIGLQNVLRFSHYPMIPKGAGDSDVSSPLPTIIMIQSKMSRSKTRLIRIGSFSASMIMGGGVIKCYCITASLYGLVSADIWSRKPWNRQTKRHLEI